MQLSCQDSIIKMYFFDYDKILDLMQFDLYYQVEVILLEQIL